VATEVLLLLALILVNGVFSGSEMAVASSRKARLQERADRGDAGARAALELSENPNRFLSTVQIGITLVGVLTGAFGGATLAASLSRLLAGVPALAPYRDALSFGLVVAVVTYLSLILGELVPKRLALNSPERTAASVARPMMALSRLAGPVVAVLGASTDAVLRLLGVKRSDEAQVTEEEIKVMIGQGAEAGVFEPGEPDLVDGVLSLGDRQVGELMTPRTRLVALDLDDPVEVNVRKMAQSPHANFPVYRGSIDSLIGLVSVKDVWAAASRGDAAAVLAPDLEGLARPPLYVPETLRALRLLERFKHRPAGSGPGGAQPELAVVIGEHGGTEGLITLTDLMEAIVGDLPGAGAAGPEAAVRREDGSWLVDGGLDADELRERLGLETVPDPSREEYHTVGGFVMQRLGSVPAPGDRFDWEGHRFEVMDMDGHRVDKVLVTPLAPPDGEHLPGAASGAHTPPGAPG
jgi:putative hemolysin